MFDLGVPEKFKTKESFLREKARARIRGYLYHVSMEWWGGRRETGARIVVIAVVLFPKGTHNLHLFPSFKIVINLTANGSKKCPIPSIAPTDY